MIKQYELEQARNTDGKVYIGICRERLYIPVFVDNRDQILMTLQKAGRTCGYFQTEGSRIDRNRDRISDQFLSLPDKPEWLQFLDSDMDHPHDISIRLSKWNKPIIAGLYFHRGSNHDPFAFMECEPRPDDYGRNVLMWHPMRDEVFDFLGANNVPMADGALTIDNCIGSPLVECDAVATGTMLIHRSVLELMERPIFEFPPYAIGEDMHFCRKAKHDYGIPIYCDFSTISGHYTFDPQGQAQFRQVHTKRGLNFAGYTKQQSIDLLAEFSGITKERAQEKIEKGARVSDYWEAKFGKTNPSQEQIEDFYRDPYTGQLYLLELLHWNFSQVFYNIKSLFMGLRRQRVIEIGSGIGSLAIQLAVQHNEVTAVEPNKVLRDFAQFRLNKVREELTTEVSPVKFVVESWKKQADGYFDAAVSTDTFEHMTEKELRDTIKELSRVLKVGGDLIYHANFKQQDVFPMHFDHEAIWDSILLENGFVPLSTTHAKKVR